MNVDIRHGLSENELSIMLEVLRPYKAKIDKAGIFGSRASDQYKDYSDIDLVLYGVLDQREIDRLNTLFDESNLGLRVDIKNYRDISYPPLKRHIDSSVRILFTKEQLNK